MKIESILQASMRHFSTPDRQTSSQSSSNLVNRANLTSSSRESKKR